jgi:hypothetical protein
MFFIQTKGFHIVQSIYRYTLTANERFGATAAGSANLKGSGKMPPLRQAATPLAASERNERTDFDDVN